MSTNQDMPLTDPNSHIMYQPTYAAYPASQSMGTWGQQPTQQAYAYTAYPQSDRASYTDSTGYNNQTFQPIHYGTATESDYYRPSTTYTYNQQPTSHWAQLNYANYNSAPGTQTAYNAINAGSAGYSGSIVERPIEQPRVNAFNTVAAQLPNMSRPPPAIKRENGDNTFHASLSMLENPAQASAAYTASWVSNATTIPPDLKEEPEMFGVLPSTDLGGAVFPQGFADQFEQLTLNTEAGPDSNQKEDSKKNIKEERRPPTRDNNDGKIPTWDERIRKAHVQKERAEFRNNSSDRPRTNERDRLDKENNRNGPRYSRGSGQIRGTSNNGSRDQHRQQRHNGGNVWRNENGDDTTHNNRNGNRAQHQNGPSNLPGIMRAPNIPLIFNPNYAIPGQTHMMIPRGMPFMAPPRHLINNIQDERFKNTWLDAAAYAFPVPYGHIAYPPVDARGFRGGRGQPSRGRAGYRGGVRNGGDYFRKGSDRKDQERQGEDQTHESSPALTTASGHTENNISPAAAETTNVADSLSPAIAHESGMVA